MTPVPASRALPALVRNGVLAALAASALTLAVLLGATGVGVPLGVSGPGETVLEIGAALVVTACVAGALGATLVLAALNAFARHPRRSFEVSALAVLALSLMPLLAGDLPAATAVSLGAMHLVAAAATMALLRPVARRSR
ncbi:DUF6069 family protein [Deinococcus budaensis]|uniref:Cell envelope biogenesis protein OmpA n=1 Tax=Deinococcus budaensis TaxID=1665626 RepID=A0A7W8GHJ0_9DEIO|nr:DUF6069 family protein [Deinococcus budaensis]MBB5235439.1 hypothetical protein [Deinococcus budaensis]